MILPRPASVSTTRWKPRPCTSIRSWICTSVSSAKTELGPRSCRAVVPPPLRSSRTSPRRGRRSRLLKRSLERLVGCRWFVYSFPSLGWAVGSGCQFGLSFRDAQVRGVFGGMRSSLSACYRGLFLALQCDLCRRFALFQPPINRLL